MENMQLNLFTDDKNVLWKYDNELGIAYFCPNCKVFLCDNEKNVNADKRLTGLTMMNIKAKLNVVND